MKKSKVLGIMAAVLVGVVAIGVVVLLIVSKNKKESVPEDIVTIEEETDETEKEAKKEVEKEPEKEVPASNTEDKKADVKSDNAPVKTHGKLTLDNTQIVDKDGNPFQIKGVSTHGLMWFPEYVGEDTFRTIRDDWQANCIRLAMYTGEGGYCTGANQAELKQLVEKGVQCATDLDMYVIIDWHILSDYDPNEHKDEAKKFFDEMSKQYADYNNVLYEICNEPNGGIAWAPVKQYAEEIIPVIRANDKDAIIIVGTPTWSQDVDIAANDPIKGYDNIMYAIHFYADTHKESLRAKMTAALDKGLPVFCSEFGICDASGNGAINPTEADEWIKLMNDRGVSYCIWNLSNKAESSSLISAGCNKLSDWSENELSDEARWYLGVLSGQASSSKSTETADKSKPISDSDKNDDSQKNQDTQKKSDTVTSNDMELTVKEDNSWDDGTYKFKQLNISIKNNGSDVSTWKVSYTLDKEYTVDQSWGGNFTISGKTLTIENVDYNKNIKAGETVKDIGVIIKCK